ncbi:MAG: hypothetical protein H6607_06545 [Flavobacteriales bacterium]|nr:hypothetical protein [Flavobacteriales bacterium]
MHIQINNRIGWVALLLAAFFGGCNNTLDVTADWKEIPVVYGLLNPSATYNYIRINKVYLNEQGNALSYAGVSDSLQFEDLTVKMVEFKDGAETNVITLEKVIGDTIGLPKDSGLFANSPNVLYRTNFPIKASSFAALYNYKLVITNNKSGKTYESKANTVGLTEVFSPVSDRTTKLSIEDDTSRFLFINYREASQAKMYDCELRFRYKEYPAGEPNKAVVDSVSWTIFKGKETIRLRGYEQQIYPQKSYVFYDFLATVLPEKPGYERQAIDVGMYFYASGEDIYTYVQVNKPSIGIVQKKPEFTNISNGLGVFSSVHIKAYDHIELTGATHSSLANSPRTEKLNFVTP